MTSQNDHEPQGFGGAGPHVATATRAWRRWLWLGGALLGLAIALGVARFLERSGPWSGPEQQAASRAEAREDVVLPGLPPGDATPRASRDSVPGASPGGAAATVKAGNAAAQAERPIPPTTQSAIEEMQRVARGVLADFPNQPDALEVSARMYLRLGQSAKAAEYWNRCVALDPRYPYAYLGLAAVAISKGDRPEQIRLLRKALAIAPNAFEAQFELAKSLFEGGRAQESLEVLQNHVRDYPRSARGHVLLGAAYLKTGALEKAKRAYETAIQLNPDDDFPYVGLATVCARLGRAEEAKRYREKFTELRAGTLRESRGRHIGYDDMESARNHLAEVCTNAGRLYRAQGNLAEAERLCRRAAQVAPGDVESRQALAWLYGQSGRTTEAIRMLEQLARLQPSAPEYPLEIGRLYAELGQKDKADEWREKAHRLNAAKGQRPSAPAAALEK